MVVRIVANAETDQASAAKDFLQITTCKSPDDDTVTLTTIQRCVDRGADIDATGTTWRVRTLVDNQPMTRDEAMGFATRYAERKHIPLVVGPSD